MTILDSIIAERRKDVAKAKKLMSVSMLKKRAAHKTHHSLVARLVCGKGPKIIAEIKKASPSAGLLCAKFKPADIARIYAKAGAAGISVLTEPHRFMGSDDHLKEVRAAVRLPVLRKDFIFDVYQVYETAALGADVLLLIVAALSERKLRELYACAMECGLDVIAEVHTKEELESALSLEKAIIGVNSRNLKNLKTDLDVARKMIGMIPKSRIAIAESGIKSRKEVCELSAAGYRGFLVGETLMRSSNPACKLREFLS